MNTLTFTILRLLADGKFHSGEDIARQLKVSRATVWNALQDAEKLGVEIFSVRGRGYKLRKLLLY
jgi:BirA family biotin operon repressor/biotin-[acetyl-CoA-carboxylase] ligase